MSVIWRINPQTDLPVFARVRIQAPHVFFLQPTAEPRQMAPITSPDCFKTSARKERRISSASKVRTADNFGREPFWGGLEPWRSKAEKFAGKIR